MKKFLKTLTSLCMVAFIIAVSAVSGFAESSLTLNGIDGVQKGDKVSYSLYLGDCKDEVVGFHMYIYYDKEYLSVDEDSLSFNDLDGQVVYNAKSDDGIIFNYSNVSTPADFSAEKLFASVDFKVLKGGKTDISFFISELYGMDMTYLKEYSFTYDLAVNGKEKINHQPPVVTNHKEFIDKNQGAFINYVDGKGEKNGKKTQNGQRETILGSTAKPTQLQVQDVTKDESKDLTKIIVPVVVALLVLAIVGVIILRKALSGNKK